MRFDDGIFGLYAQTYENRREVELSLEDYLRACSDDSSFYAGPAERLLKAIGDPIMVDTAQDPRLGRIFMNRTIKVHPAFADDFFGMEDTIERIVGFFRHAAQGLEERKQVLYLLGPVGGGKSSLAERLKQICVAKTEPGDENNQDVASLVGKVDIRKLEMYSQNDPDAYSFSGGLNRTTQGLMEFVEMFKAPIKMLHPLLTATQEGNYAATENIGGIPYQGIILAHSNEAEWQSFKNNKNNEAFIDRISVIKVPYCLRATEERKIYEKLLHNSELANAACAPSTLDILSRFCVLSRLKPHENSNLYSKMRVYDGESLKDTDPRAKSVQEYRDAAGVDEGMDGISTRFAFKVLSSTFNFDTQEVAADPVHLMYVLEQAIWREQFPEDSEKKFLNFIKAELAPRYAEFIGHEIQKAYLESYSDYGQNLFDRYVAYADAWIEDSDYKDPDTGQLMNRELLNQELSKIEKPAGIANPKDFRNEVVKFALRARAANAGRNPAWTSYEKLREVIERRMFSQVEDLLPVISFGSKKDSDTEKKHADFVDRMVDRGYTERQVRRLVEWYMRVNKAG